MSLDNLLIMLLAAYSMAYLLVKEDAPFGVMKALRARTTLGGLLNCIYCSMFWCSVACYVLLPTPLAPIVYVFAIRGGAMFVHRYTGGDYNG